MLRVEGLSKSFGAFSMSDVSFEVSEGEYFVLLGPSGTGKTVLLETLAGMMEADDGRIILRGRDITRERVQKRGIGLVFQDQALFPHMTARANIAYGLHGRVAGKAAIQARVEQLAEEMEISHLLERMPGTLSGGEAQRVALARALGAEPDCLLLDEPLSSLDTGGRSRMRGLLRRLNRKKMTIIHVTHDYEEALSLASRVGIMEDGRIVQVDSPERIFRDPGSEFVARFIGIKNFFRGRIERRAVAGGGDPAAGGDIVAGRVTTAGAEPVFISEGIKLDVLTSLDAGDAVAVIRSEDIVVSIEPVSSSARNVIAGVIIDIVPVRGGVEILIDAGVELAAMVTPRSVERLGLEIGTKIYSSIKASAIRVLDG
ncbi:MAG: ABC transporter ATP-binding protein [Candidatus Krumholzibacteria bacterium]|nr:ABC transporter ATP-binding protein [Candidatus Krumholzibacteria bacterium]